MPNSELDPILELACWVLGDEANDVFVVKIDKTKNVFDLKEMIKKQRRPALDNVIASALRLIQVSPPIAVDNDFKKKLSEFRLDDKETILPLQEMEDLFPSPPLRKHLHIIVQLPPAIQTTPSYALHCESPQDALRILRQRFLAKVPNLAPSSQAVPKKFARQQNDDDRALYCNRPVSTRASIPVTLLHPIFGEFVDDCDTHIPTEEDNSLVLDLSQAMSDFYEDENARASKFREILIAHDFDIAATTVDGTHYATDGDLRQHGHRYLIVEVKLEIAGGGAEPFAQVTLYYLESTRVQAPIQTASNFPCFLLVIFGAHIGFAGAVWNTRPNMQVLSPTLPLFWHPTDKKMRTTAARYFGAFRKAIRSLHSYYKDFFPTIDKLHRAMLPNPRFPHQSHYISLENQTSIRFQYSYQIVDDKLVFIGETEAGDDICIKFTHDYSVDAHLICASKGFAPALRGFESLPGGWHMVVMDVVGKDYKHICDSAPAARIAKEIFGKVESLHQAGYVHGDLRSTNLVVRTDGKPGFMLLDFDWAGKIEEVRYPMNVNKGQHLWRPPGARDGQYILAEHDMSMLHVMFNMTSEDVLPVNS